MEVNPQMFRGYDLRGLVDKDLTPEIVEYVGRAFGTYLKRQKIAEAVVGRDFRASSHSYSNAIIEGLTWAGITITDIGLTLVGTFYWSQHHLKKQGGVYVSASHNPKEYNGFKFANNYSETLVSDGIQEIRRMVEQDDYEKAEIPGTVSKKNVQETYFKDILRRLQLNKKFKVLIDPSCSTAGAIAPDLLRQAGCEVIEKNTNLDPSFPLGHADPTDTVVMKRLQKEVIEAGADLGITYDPDGDRIGVVDETGAIVWNDMLVALFATDVLADHPKATIMFNTLCSKIVPETIIAHGGTPFMWRTGHSFLKKKNQEVGAAFIGELSGHFFFSSDFYNHDDGLYSTMRLLRYLSRTNQTLSQVIKKLPLYISSPEIKLFCPDDKKVEVSARIGEQAKYDFPDGEVISDERAGDGVRLELQNGMFVVRYSQNGPYLTIKFEAKNKEKYEEIRQYIHATLHNYKEIDWKHDINVSVDTLTD